MLITLRVLSIILICAGLGCKSKSDSRGASDVQPNWIREVDLTKTLKNQELQIMIDLEPHLKRFEKKPYEMRKELLLTVAKAQAELYIQKNPSVEFATMKVTFVRLKSKDEYNRMHLANFILVGTVDFGVDSNSQKLVLHMSRFNLENLSVD